MDKGQIADILSEIGTLLELKGEDRLQDAGLRQRRARAWRAWTSRWSKLIAENRLGEIKGIGEACRRRSANWPRPASWPITRNSRRPCRRGWWQCSQIPGLGPKKVKALHDKLGVETIEQLEKACQDGKVAELDGFGEKTQAKILEGIQFRRQYASRHLLSDALGGGRADSGESAPASRRGAVQHGGQPAALQGGHWRH